MNVDDVLIVGLTPRAPLEKGFARSLTVDEMDFVARFLLAVELEAKRFAVFGFAVRAVYDFVDSAAPVVWPDAIFYPRRQS